MEVKVLREAGYEEAMLGLSLSFNQEPGKMPEVAQRLKDKDWGHNKFLESICVWIDVKAPRGWWQEFDTYRVGMTKQSESTMHTILKRPLTREDFQDGISPWTLAIMNKAIENKDWRKVKYSLPEGFLQRRILTTNYKTLRNIFEQRKNHKLNEWHVFIGKVKAGLKHPELLADVSPAPSKMVYKTRQSGGPLFTDECRDTFREAVDKFGFESQVFMAMEEAAKFQKAIAKLYRNFDVKEIVKVAEEMGDLLIMLEQIKILIGTKLKGFDDLLKDQVVFKVRRLRGLLERHDNGGENEAEKA